MKYKVRIKKAPDTMAYGGQTNYGLDLGARGVYQNTEDNPYENVSNTLQPIDRSLANIEAELGETVMGDFDQDGQNEHMKIGGKPHSQGGTPLKVPEGSFVFSKTKKMKIGGPVLSMFGKSATTKKKYSPADLAKQYNINKYRAVLDDPYADQISKSTAARMIDNYEKKLGGLALLQESKKGFPQGIPNIAMPFLRTMMPMEQEQDVPMAKYGGYYFDDGGLTKYQTKGEVNPPLLPERPRISPKEVPIYEAQGYKRVGNTNVWRKTTSGKDVKDVVVTPGAGGTSSPGTPGQIIPGDRIKGGSDWKAPAGCANLLYTVEDVKARPGCYNTFLNKNGFKDASEEDMKKGLREWIRGNRPTYKPGVPPTKTDPRPETRTCEDGYTIDPNDPTKCIKENEETREVEVTDTNTNTNTKDSPSAKKRRTPSLGSFPFFGTQFMVPPKKYFPYASPLNAVIPYPAFYDPNRELAEGASQRKMTAEYMSNLDPQAYSARVAALNAQGAEQAANTIGRYQNMNVGVANQFSPLQTDIMNKIMAYRADAMDKVVHNAQQEDKAYRNSWRSYGRNLDMYDINRYMYNTQKNMLNAINPWFNLVDGPRGGNMVMRPGVTWDDIVTGRIPGTSTSPADTEKMETEALRLKLQGLDGATINEILRRKYPQASSSRISPSTLARNYMSLNPGMISGYSAYPFSSGGFDISGYDD